MVDRLRAVNYLYEDVAEAVKNEDGSITAKNSNGDIIELDYTLIDAWQDPEAYAFARQDEYAPLKQQLDMMYHDKVNGTTTWEDHINSVKTNNPKPTE
jgi:quinol monooxygenase YgiN